MQKIALLGLGTMGSGMAANWLKKGFQLAVFNRTAAKAAPFAALGARVAVTPADAAVDADVILAMVTDDAASREVWVGGDGALMSARPGAIAIESSTVSPGWVAELAGYVKAHECDFLDAPVTGSKDIAAAGELVMFVGGDTATLEKARPVLAAISRSVLPLGPGGSGATWKLINNMLLAVHIAAVSEGLALAEKAGFDLKGSAERILASGTSSPIVRMKMPRFVEGRYGEADFALRHMSKDLGYALALAGRAGVDVTTVRAAASLYREAEARGLGDLDFAEVLKTVAE